MTDSEKIIYTQSLCNDANLSQTDVETYLALAGQRILEARYPYQDISDKAVPSRYHRTQCELASRMIFRRGFEGQFKSNENGIIREWSSEDDVDILNRIIPLVGVK